MIKDSDYLAGLCLSPFIPSDDDWKKIKAALPALLAENEAQAALLRGLLEWDHFDGAGDGAYWRKEIKKVLGERP